MDSKIILLAKLTSLFRDFTEESFEIFSLLKRKSTKSEVEIIETYFSSTLYSLQKIIKLESKNNYIVSSEVKLKRYINEITLQFLRINEPSKTLENLRKTTKKILTILKELKQLSN